MNRLDSKFKKLKEKKQKAFIAYITCGDPDLKTTAECLKVISDNGADIIELGVPFSDPLADGSTIQAASQKALKNNVSLHDIVKMVAKVRSKIDIPLVLMTYYNPVFHYDIRSFIKDAKKAGVDGIIIPDLPPEEASQIEMFGRKADIATIYFVSPTSSTQRKKISTKHSKGFIYYVSITGVTGKRKVLPAAVKKDVSELKKITSKPICVGFGISTPKQAKDIAKFADGVIVGSAIVEKIDTAKNKKEMIKSLGAFIKQMAKAVH
jgi:tryptophan synthase alpha chain